MNIFQNIGALLTSSRFKSFYWRTGMMSLASFLTLLANNLGDLGLTPQFAIFAGLVLGEVSKAVNNAIAGKDVGITS